LFLILFEIWILGFICNLVLVICYFRFIRDELFVAPKSAMTTARMPSFSEGGLQKKFLI